MQMRILYFIINMFSFVVSVNMWCEMENYDDLSSHHEARPCFLVVTLLRVSLFFFLPSTSPQCGLVWFVVSCTSELKIYGSTIGVWNQVCQDRQFNCFCRFFFARTCCFQRTCQHLCNHGSLRNAVVRSKRSLHTHTHTHTSACKVAIVSFSIPEVHWLVLHHFGSGL